MLAGTLVLAGGCVATPEVAQGSRNSETGADWIQIPVESSPSGAAITLDGKPVGTTPGVISVEVDAVGHLRNALVIKVDLPVYVHGLPPRSVFRPFSERYLAGDAPPTRIRFVDDGGSAIAKEP